MGNPYGLTDEEIGAINAHEAEGAAPEDVFARVYDSLYRRSPFQAEMLRYEFQGYPGSEKEGKVKIRLAK